MPWRLEIASTTMKPILCRLPAYREPGLPSPTRSSMAAPITPRRAASEKSWGYSDSDEKYSLFLGLSGSSTSSRSHSRRGAGGRAFDRSSRRGRSCRCGSSCGFRSWIDLFGVTGRRHNGNECLVQPAHHAYVRWERNLVEVLGVVDLQPGNIDIDCRGNGIGRAYDLDRVGHDIDGTAAFYPRCLVRIHHMHRDAHAQLRPFGQAQEIHMHGRIVNRVELKVARDHPLLDPIDIKLAQGREKPACINALLELGMIDRDVERRLRAAVNHARHPARTPLCARRALAGVRPRGRLHLPDGRHDANPSVFGRGYNDRDAEVQETCSRAKPRGSALSTKCSGRTRR